jgi:phospholipid/cholesterol/gamma-HCH transport system substrate-binding protein
MDKKVLVGFLLLSALFTFGLATFYVDNWQVVFGDSYELQARFAEAGTLDVGDDVRMAGVPVGSVTAMKIDPDAAELPVAVTVRIDKEVVIRQGDEAVVRVTSVFGGSLIEIDRGPRDAAPLAQNGSGVITETAVAGDMADVIEESGRALVEVREAFEEVNALAEEIRTGQGTLARLVNDKELFDRITGIVTDVEASAGSLKVAAARIEAGEGFVGKLIMDDELGKRLDEVSSEAAAIARDINAGKGFLGKIIKDDKLYVAVEAAVKEISDTAHGIREGSGLLARLINDEQLAADGSALIKEARTIATNLREGKGAFGKLLTDDAAYNDLMAVLNDLKAAAQNLTNGEGTLGLLIKDPTLHNQAKALLTDFQAIMEAYREQAPLITFAGSILGAF